MTGLPEALTSRVGFLLLQASAAVGELGERALVEVGISGREYGVLTLVAHRGPSTQRALGAALHLDRTTTTKILSELERRSLVARTRDPRDGRAYAVAITPHGDELRARAQVLLADCEERFLEPLSARQRSAVREALAILVAGPLTSG